MGDLHVGCWLKFHYLVGCQLKFSTFVEGPEGGFGSHFPVLFYEKSHSHLGFFSKIATRISNIVYYNKPIK